MQLADPDCTTPPEIDRDEKEKEAPLLETEPDAEGTLEAEPDATVELPPTRLIVVPLAKLLPEMVVPPAALLDCARTFVAIAATNKASLWIFMVDY